MTNNSRNDPLIPVVAADVWPLLRYGPGLPAIPTATLSDRRVDLNRVRIRDHANQEGDSTREHQGTAGARQRSTLPPPVMALPEFVAQRGLCGLTDSRRRRGVARAA